MDDDASSRRRHVSSEASADFFPNLEFFAMDCSETLAHLWEYLDDELPVGDGDALRAHLDTCPACRTAHRFDDAFLTRVAKLAAACNAPPVLLLRIQGALRSPPLH